jgi:hypothetical protein
MQNAVSSTLLALANTNKRRLLLANWRSQERIHFREYRACTQSYRTAWFPHFDSQFGPS